MDDKEKKKEWKEVAGQRSSSSGSKGNICWNNHDRKKSEGGTARNNPFTRKKVRRKEEMSEEVLDRGEKKEAAGAGSSSSGSSSPEIEGKKCKDNLVRKNDGIGTVSKLPRKDEQQVEVDKDTAKAANQNRKVIAKQQEQKQVDTVIEEGGVVESRMKETPTQRQREELSNPLVRNRTAAARGKEQMR